jgi:hypothetical protein
MPQISFLEEYSETEGLFLPTPPTGFVASKEVAEFVTWL